MQTTSHPIKYHERRDMIVQVRVAFPNVASYRFREDMEHELCAYAGGFTSYPSIRGWLDHLGDALVEHGAVYAVSLADPGENQIDNVLGIFRAHAAAAGEQELYAELWHGQTRRFALTSKYPSPPLLRSHRKT